MEMNFFEKTFGNKRVAVVGNSKGLLSTNLGKEIDSPQVDVVCRINKAFKILPPYRNEYEVHIGKRMDVLFVNLLRTVGFRNANKEQTKIVQTSPCSYDDPRIISGILHVPERIHFQKIFDEFAPKKPSTGMRVLHLLKTLGNPKSVSVFGFDWKTKNPSFYGFSDDWSQTEHDFAKEQEYCMTNYFYEGSNFILRQHE